MTMKSFWMKWRAELLRGAVIFVVVVGIGMALFAGAQNLKDRLKTSTADIIPALARGLSAKMGGDFDAPGRTHGDSWSWRGTLKAGQTLVLRNVNGPIEVTAAPGAETIVNTEKSWVNSDPSSVTVQAVPTSSGTLVCAVWPGATNGCDGGHNVNIHFDSRQHNDVAVKFVVQLARGVKLDAGSVNGEVDVAGADAAVAGTTVNGDLQVETASWPVTLSTTNGDVSAKTGTPGADQAEVKSVNGDVSVDIPEKSNVTVNASSVHGDITNDFSLTVNQGKFAGNSMLGTLGKGGSTLTLNTVNGDISLGKATAATVVHVARKHGVTVVNAVPTPTPAPPAPAKP